MRSIGKVRIRKLKQIVAEESKKMEPYSMNTYQWSEACKNRIPDDWYDTWESAWCEIERLINEEINTIKYRR